ncbi:hypothetical protein PACTADRAFT_49562 [Pachysolen tannophilus NRRL Y-2460]|uniref:Cyclin N-terminal domain-containing protein n=1 Tax=Pachysolen tannophilus NRRL Y-2460 TaxID=669874 RepID=A0A1E4TWQ8_PACTA|nr:hypothetical protein PACTADRAFT_49562 [Pachysolen tannophilus NRRL Y-2460]
MVYSSLEKASLKVFLRKPVAQDMVSYLAATTDSVIKIKPSSPNLEQYPTPPSTPMDNKSTTNNNNNSNSSKQPVALTLFIERLISYSNVQTPTLMSTLVYLIRLRSILPSNSYGIESTRHRLFLGCLILAAKNLNDSSPLNKHWAKYTDGALSIKEVNTIERELLGYLNWDLRISNTDLINCLSPFLQPIKEKLKKDHELSLLRKQQSVQSLQSLQSYNNYNTPINNGVQHSRVTVTPSYSSNGSIPELMKSSASNSTLASNTSSVVTPSNSSHFLNASANNTTDTTIKEESEYITNYYFKKNQPTNTFKPKPLRLRSSYDNLSNITNNINHNTSDDFFKKFSEEGKENNKSNNNYQSQKTGLIKEKFSLLTRAGRVIA